MAGVMKALIAKHDLQGDEVDAFNSMYDFIAGRRNLNEKFKKAYENGPDWNYISTEDEAANFGKVVDDGFFRYIRYFCYKFFYGLFEDFSFLIA